MPMSGRGLSLAAIGGNPPWSGGRSSECPEPPCPELPSGRNNGRREFTEAGPGVARGRFWAPGKVRLAGGLDGPQRPMTIGAAVTDGDALIRSILANPADDAPRLVYADWLQEHGRGEDAEFIRVQVELARLGFDGGFHTDDRGRLRHAPPHVAALTER